MTSIKDLEVEKIYNLYRQSFLRFESHHSPFFIKTLLVIYNQDGERFFRDIGREWAYSGSIHMVNKNLFFQGREDNDKDHMSMNLIANDTKMRYLIGIRLSTSIKNGEPTAGKVFCKQIANQMLVKEILNSINNRSKLLREKIIGQVSPNENTNDLSDLEMELIKIDNLDIESNIMQALPTSLGVLEEDRFIQSRHRV